MNRRLVSHLVFAFLLTVGIAILLSAVASFLMSDPLRDMLSLAFCGLAVTLPAAGCFFLTRPKTEEQRKYGFREAFAVVAIGWLAAPLIGAVPFIVSGFPVCDAVFEITSGFSTTGATIVAPGMRLRDGRILVHGIESLSYGLLFFRALSHWLGGMGIVVLTIAILSLFDISGQGLFNAESTGLKSADTKIAPRIASAAKILWLLYVCLTGFETIFLYLGGMTFFDALCHSFSTIAAGGFSTKNASIGAYHSVYIETVTIFFMFLSGCNFMLHIRAITARSLREYKRDGEWCFYTLVTVFAAIGIAFYLYFLPGSYTTFSSAFRAAVFQVVAIITTTGFSTDNYAAWPVPCGMILFILMFIGGCGGSTSGGMKCIRVLLVAKHSLSELRRCIFPHLVPDIRLNGGRIERPVIQKVVGFMTFFFGLFLLFALLAALLCPSMDLLTALSVSLSSISNIGPGFGGIGPEATWNWMTPAAKILLAFEMLLGRLELFTVLVLFLPSFWKK